MADVELVGSEDFSTWEWGEPPAPVMEAHKQSCIIGAETLLKDIGKDGWFGLAGWHEGDDKLRIYFGMFDNLSIQGELNFPDPEDLEPDDIDKLVTILRKIADNLERKSAAVWPAANEK